MDIKSILNKIIKENNGYISKLAYLKILDKCKENNYTEESDIKKLFDKENNIFSNNLKYIKDNIGSNCSSEMINKIADKCYLKDISADEICKNISNMHKDYINIMFKRGKL